MERRQFLSVAGFGTIGALAGLTALPAQAKKKKRRDMTGEYEGTVNVDGENVPFTFAVEEQNKKNGKFEGNADIFGEIGLNVTGRVSSGSSVLEFEGVLGDETIQIRGQILDRGKRITGTWKAIKEGEVVSQGTFTVNKVTE